MVRRVFRQVVEEPGTSTAAGQPWEHTRENLRTSFHSPFPARQGLVWKTVSFILARQTWVLVPVLPFTSCVNWMSCLSSQPSLLHLQADGSNNTYLTLSSWESNEKMPVWPLVQQMVTALSGFLATLAIILACRRSVGSLSVSPKLWLFVFFNKMCGLCCHSYSHSFVLEPL